MKHWRGLIKLLMIVAVLSILSIGAAAYEYIRIDIHDTEATSGELITVPVEVIDNPGVVSMTIDVKYDVKTLKLVAVTDTGLLPGEMHSNIVDFPYRLTWENDTAEVDFTKSGNVAELVFRVADNAEVGNTEIYFSDMEALNSDGEKIVIAYNTGRIDVCAEHVHEFQLWEKYSNYRHVRTCECGEEVYEKHSWDDGEVIKEPTQDRTGLEVYTCHTCAGTKEVILPIVPSEEPETQQIAIAGCNMTLGNDLKINFLVKSADVANGSYTVKISQSGRETVTQTLKKYNSTYHYARYSVAAKEMADTISVEIYNEDGQLISAPFTRSVKQYAMTLLNNASQPAKLKSVIVDMLHYGKCAQEYFGYNEDNYADCDVTEEQLAYGTRTIVTRNDQVAGANFVGTSLSLGDSVCLNAFFKGVTNTAGMTATVEFVDYKGKTVKTTAPVEKYGNMCKVAVDELVMADAKCLVTVKVYKADGSLYGSGADSIRSYVYRNRSNNSVGTICFAIMAFATSSYNYLGGTQ